ncbi:MAG TPA: glycosyltransferase family 4 protein [Solirubrobacterales bacterium]|nr:glycosyltransferase family 4 protein [Solirubrobacterales bacterium]
MKTRVVHLGPDPAGPGGGMPAVIASLLSSPLADRYTLEAIPTYRDRRPFSRLLLFARALVKLVRWCAGRGPRIVHVHVAARGSLYRKGLVVGTAKAMRRPVVLHLHAGPGDLDDFLARLGPLRRRLLRAPFLMADRVLSVSSSGAAALRQGLVDVEVTVVPNAPPPVSAPPRRSGGGEVTALYLGGFYDPAKGGEVLLEGLPRLLERSPATTVLLAGPGSPPREPASNGRWQGWLDGERKSQAMEEADLFVLPSISEGMPVALLEAMASGMAIVATTVGGVPELLEDGVDAALVPPGQPNQLVDAVAGLAADPERRARFGRAAAERARRLADEDVYGRLDRIYAELAR